MAYPLRLSEPFSDNDMLRESREVLNVIFLNLEHLMLGRESNVKKRIIDPGMMGRTVCRHLLAKKERDEELPFKVKARVETMKTNLVTSELHTAFREFQLDIFESFASGAWVEASDEHNKRKMMLTGFERILRCLFEMYPTDTQIHGVRVLQVKWEICAKTQGALVRDAFDGNTPPHIQAEVETLVLSVNNEGAR